VKDTAPQQKPTANEQNATAPKPENTLPQPVVETNKLFVGGLPPKTTDADLKEYFLQFGKIENVNLMIDQQTSRHRGFGFITFVEQKDARSCLDFDSEHKLHEKVIDVKTAVSRTQNQARQNSDYNRPGPFLPNHFSPMSPFSNGGLNGPQHMTGFQLPQVPMMGHPGFPVPPFASGPTYHHHHNHFYMPHSPNSLQNKPRSSFQPNLPFQHKKQLENLDENVNSSQKLDPNSTEFTSAVPQPTPSSTENPERSNNQSPTSKTSESKNSSAATGTSAPPANQYINQQQQIMQMPNLGPHAWGGFHPQHAHQLTYAKIFVGGLKRETTKQDLEAYFSNFGKVRKLDLVMDPQDQGRNRGFAFVQYETVEACEGACGQQYHTIDGHKVEVKRAILKMPGLSNMNDAPGINPGSVYGRAAAANGFPIPFIPQQMNFNPYMYQGNFGYDQQMKPGVQQNLPAPKNEEVEQKVENGLKSQMKVDENNNKIDTDI
jgi:RNA recognition motif-containing protein